MTSWDQWADALNPDKLFEKCSIFYTTTKSVIGSSNGGI